MPDYGPARVLRARVLAGAGKFDAAAVLVDAILERDSKDYEAWLLRGEIMGVAKSDAKGAEESYRKALAVEPAYMTAHAALISLSI